MNEVIIKKKGFGLVEVVCSLLIFSLIATSLFKFKITSNKMRNRDKKIQEYSCYISGLKYNLLKNFSYDEIKSLKEKSKLNIPSESIDVDLLHKGNLKNIFKKEENNQYPKVTMKIDDFKENNVFEIKLSIYFLINDTVQSMSTEFLKGNY